MDRVRRALLAAVAVALACGVVAALPAVPAAAAAGAAEHELAASLRAFVDADAGEGGNGVAPRRAKAVCRFGGTDDPVDAPALDIRDAVLVRECSAPPVWALAVRTYDEWDVAEFSDVGALLDSDANLATGCDGFDHGVVHDGANGGVVATPTCDEATWSALGAAQIDSTALDDVIVGWDAAILDLSGPIRVAAWLASIHSPDADFTADFVVGAAASTSPPGTFSNGRCEIPRDETATNNSVARLYHAYFLRPADQGGLDYWVPKYRSGELCLTDISEYFAQSQEFLSRYGDVDIPNFVRLVYVNVLGREPDPDGYNYWADQLAHRGMRRGTMMVGFSESPEFRSRTGLP